MNFILTFIVLLFGASTQFPINQNDNLDNLIDIYQDYYKLYDQKIKDDLEYHRKFEGSITDYLGLDDIVVDKLRMLKKKFRKSCKKECCKKYMIFTALHPDDKFLFDHCSAEFNVDVDNYDDFSIQETLFDIVEGIYNIFSRG